MITYYNRYSDKINFDLQEDRIIVTGYNSDYVWYSSDTEGEIHSADPSGGPYLFVGMRLGTLIPELKGLEVTKISSEPGQLTLYIKRDDTIREESSFNGSDADLR
jgi:hypothetical protein